MIGMLYSILIIPFKGKGMLSRTIGHFVDGGYYLHNWVECNKCFKQFILVIIVSFVLKQKMLLFETGSKC